jgi:hypothetical protein
MAVKELYKYTQTGNQSSLLITLEVNITREMSLPRNFGSGFLPMSGDCGGIFKLILRLSDWRDAG